MGANGGGGARPAASIRRRGARQPRRQRREEKHDRHSAVGRGQGTGPASPRSHGSRPPTRRGQPAATAARQRYGPRLASRDTGSPGTASPAGQPGYGQPGSGYPGPWQPGYGPPRRARGTAPAGPQAWRHPAAADRGRRDPRRRVHIHPAQPEGHPRHRRRGADHLAAHHHLALSLLNLSQLGPEHGHGSGRAPARPVWPALPVLGVTALLAFIVQILLTGLLTAVVGRSVAATGSPPGRPGASRRPGCPPAARDPAHRPRPHRPLGRARPLLLIVLAAGAPGGVLIAIGFLGIIASLVLDAWFWTMFSMSAAAVVLERQGPARRWGVPGGWWRKLLAGVRHPAARRDHRAVASSVLRLPFTIISAAFSSGSLARRSSRARSSRVVGGIVAGAITQPISAGVTVLLYVDLRMRREGLDLALQTAASDGPPADDFATVWRPPGPASRATPGPRRPAARPARRPPDRRGRPADVVTAARGTVVAVLASAARGPGHRQEGGAAARPRGAGQARVPPSRLADRGRLLHSLTRVVNAASGAVPGGWWALVALAALAVIVTAGVLNWIGPLARSHRGSGPLAAGGKRAPPAITGRRRGAGQRRRLHRRDHRVRAGDRGSSSSGACSRRLGRTADEFAAEAGQALPVHADALRDAARQFDEIRYGQRPGSRRRLRAAQRARPADHGERAQGEQARRARRRPGHGRRAAPPHDRVGGLGRAASRPAARYGHRRGWRRWRAPAATVARILVGGAVRVRERSRPGRPPAARLAREAGPAGASSSRCSPAGQRQARVKGQPAGGPALARSRGPGRPCHRRSRRRRLPSLPRRAAAPARP